MQRYLFVLFFFLFLLAACNTSQPNSSVVDEDLGNPEAFESLAAGGWSGRKIINTNVIGEVQHLAVDKSGGVVVSGLIFPNDVPKPFLVRYASNGARLWTRYPGLGGPLAIDGAGNVYQASDVTRPNTVLANCSSEGGQIAVSKFNAQGNKAWTKVLCAKDNPAAFGGGGSSTPKLAVTPEGRVYVVGAFTGEFCGTLNQSDLPAQFGPSDAFIVALNTNGTQAWCKTLNSPKYDSFNDVDVSANGTVYVAASSSIDLNRSKGLVISYDTNGQEIWRRSSEQLSQLGDTVNQLEVSNGNLYLQTVTDPANGGRPAIVSLGANGGLLESGNDYEECSGSTGFFVGPKNLLYVAGSIFNSEGAYSYNYVSQCSGRGVVNTIRRWFDSDVIVYATGGNKTDSIFIAGVVSQGIDGDGNFINPRPFVQKLTATLGD
jgi:hypothetical protein